MFAFNGCSSFKGFGSDAMSNLSYIGDFAFNGCSSFEGELYLVGQETEFEDGFYNYIEISNNAFRGCSSIESISIDGYRVTLGGDAFRDCTSLKDVTFGFPYIEYGFDIGTFAGCTSLETMTLGYVSVTTNNEECMEVFENSIVDEDMSWYEGCKNFKVVFINTMNDEVTLTTTIDEIYANME